MRSKLIYTAPVGVSDSLGEPIKDIQVLSALAEISCLQGTVIEYLDPSFPHRTELQGGYLRLVLDGKQLRVAIEIDSPRKLTKAELTALRDDLDGQVSDGIGEGGFDFVSDAVGLTIQTFPDRGKGKSKLVQEAGDAWRPESLTAENIVNRKRCEEAAMIATALERAKDEKSAKKKVQKPNPKNLFKLIQKGFYGVPVAGMEEAFAAEIAKLGGDLSFIDSRQLPYRRLVVPALLKMLLDAGLRPNLYDADGHSLLWSANSNVECVQMLLDHGADVNLRNATPYQDTALMDAASRGDLELVRLFLDRGADPTLKDFFGRSALDLARNAKGYPDAEATAQLLEGAIRRSG